MRPAILAFSAVPLLALTLAAAPTPQTKHWSLVMTPAQEVPGPGAAGGSGTAKLSVTPATGRICYDLSVSGMPLATAAHIHKGAVGVAGPVAMPLTAPDAKGHSHGCGTDAALAKAILADPSAYYVNVHTGDHPKGALRAQLGEPQ